jgi:hypothetical protein
MATAQYSSGLIGLGSRLFLGKENTWGSAVTGDDSRGLEVFNIYPQPGGRPQKTYSSIEVPQLFPSMFRLKPLKGRTNVAGSFTFSLPKENLGVFLALITGDKDSWEAAGITKTYEMQEVNNQSWTMIQTLGNRQAARYTGMKANSMTINVTTDSVVSFDIDFMGKNEEFTGDLGTASNETILSSWFQYPTDIDSDTVNVSTVQIGDLVEIVSLGDLTNGTADQGWNLFSGSGTNTTYAAPNQFTAATAGPSGSNATVKRLDIGGGHPFTISGGNITALNNDTGIVAEDASEVVSGDIVVVVTTNGTTTEANWIDMGAGNTAEADPAIGSKFKAIAAGVGDSQVKILKQNFDKFVDVFSSTETTLTVTDEDGKVVGSAGATVGDLNPASANGPKSIIPFSDFSLTISNSLDFPVYINGTQDPNEPIPSAFKEITGSMTVPFNQHTDDFVTGLYARKTYKAKLTIKDSTHSIVIDMPNFCLTGDGSPGTIAEGEITLPISFGVYAGTDTTNFYDSTNTLNFTVIDPSNIA